MPNTINIKNSKSNCTGRPLSPTKAIHFCLIINTLLLLILISSTVYAQGDQYGYNPSNVTIPDAGGWVSSNITISGAPADAVVTGIDVFFKSVHPYSGDLNIDPNTDINGILGNYDLWEREGGSADDPSKTVTGITTFNGLSINRTWYLYASYVLSLVMLCVFDSFHFIPSLFFI